MEANVLIGCIAALSGFACFYASAVAATSVLRKRRAAIAAQGEQPNAKNLVFWRLRNGYAPLVPAAVALMKIARVRKFAQELGALCARRGRPSSPQAVLSVVIAATLCLAAISAAVTGGPVGAVAVPACCVALLAVFVGNERDKRQEAVRDAVPAALESMSACFGSGFTLLQTFRQVADDVPDPLGATFARSAHILEMGGSAESALSVLRDGAHASELAFVAVALDVQHQSGGAMRQVLDAATDTVKGELALRRSLRVQTAQAKLSARVVAIMPFILVAAFSLASPDFLSPFFSGPIGYALLMLAIVMQVAGIFLVRRALAVEGVS